MASQMAHTLVKPDWSIARFPDRFVGAALSHDWFGPFQPIPKPLLALIAVYYCVNGYEWSPAKEMRGTIEPQLSSRAGEEGLTIANFVDPSTISMIAVYSTARLGEGGRDPYFAVRFSQVASTAQPESFVVEIGVMDTSTSRIVRRTRWALVHHQLPNDIGTSSASLDADGCDNETELTVGEPPVSVDSKNIGHGFVWNDVVLGVVYDPADDGSLHFYVNDKRVWSSARHKPFAFQTGVSPTQCYPFVESYGVSFQVELIDDWRPPACDDH